MRIDEGSESGIAGDMIGTDAGMVLRKASLGSYIGFRNLGHLGIHQYSG